MRYFLLVVSMIFLFTTSIYAGRMTDEWKLTIKKDYDSVISKLEKKSGKTAEGYYLLGKAHYEKGNNIKAAEAWKEALKITKANKSKAKWDFLFPPKSLRTKKLTGKKKKKLYTKFQNQYEEVKGAAANALRNSAKDKKRKADKKKIDAKRNLAKAKRATAKANAKTEAIRSKQRVADRKARSKRRVNRTRRSSGGGSMVGIIIFLLIVGVIIFFVVKGKSSGHSGRSRGPRRRIGNYDVYYDDEIFDMGAFWYDGVYYRHERDYYDRYGHHFTNRMYADGYDEYADRYENGYDEALDNEILDDVDEREDYRNEAADANYDADMDNADADEYNNEARYDNEDADEYDDAGEAFDDEPDFQDEEDEEEDEEW